MSSYLQTGTWYQVQSSTLGTEEMAMSKVGMTLPFWGLVGHIQLSYPEKSEAEEF